MLPLKKFAPEVLLLFFIYAGTAFGKELFDTGETIRSFGMGGARIGSDHGASTYLVNPAHLRFTNGLNWRLIGLGAGINGLDVYNEAKDTQVNGLNSISQFYGQRVWVGAEGDSTISLPYFGVGVYDQAHADGLLHDPAMPELDMTYLNDLGAVVGFAIPLGPEAGFGVNLKRIQRTGGPQVIGADVLQNATSSSLLDQFEDQGVGYGIDLGMIYEAEAPFHPALSVAWQDVGSTSFVKTGGLNAPEPIKDNLTAGVSASGQLPLIGIAAGAEYRHITDADEQLGKKIHFGAELSLAMIDLRGGFYQGYPTYGAGLNLYFMQIDAAIYTVELGAYPGQTPEQRFQVGFNMDFTLDPDFSLVGASGHPRHVKQRR